MISKFKLLLISGLSLALASCVARPVTPADFPQISGQPRLPLSSFRARIAETLEGSARFQAVNPNGVVFASGIRSSPITEARISAEYAVGTVSANSTSSVCVMATIATPILNSHGVGIASLEPMNGGGTRFTITSFDRQPMHCQMLNPMPFPELIELRQKRIAREAALPVAPPKPE